MKRHYIAVAIVCWMTMGAMTYGGVVAHQAAEFPLLHYIDFRHADYPRTLSPHERKKEADDVRRNRRQTYGFAAGMAVIAPIGFVVVVLATGFFSDGFMFVIPEHYLQEK